MTEAQNAITGLIGMKMGHRILTILIAHRLSTIMHAYTIYVLEKGKVVEAGSHDTLLANKGLYYALWRQQIGERRASYIFTRSALLSMIFWLRLIQNLSQGFF